MYTSQYVFYLKNIDTLFSMDTIHWLKMTVKKDIFNVTKMTLVTLVLLNFLFKEFWKISKNMKQHEQFLTVMIIRNAFWAPNYDF